MLPNSGQELFCLCNQFLALDDLIFQLLAILEISRVFFFPFLIIVNGFHWKVGYEGINIGLYLVQLTF